MAKIIEMPKLGFDMAEGTLVSWVKAEGEKIEKGEVLAEIETDKATVQVESSASGILYKQLIQADTTLPIGSPIAVIAEEGESVDLEELLGDQSSQIDEGSKQSEIEKAEAETEVLTSEEESADVEDFIKASPLARSMAKENALDLTQLKGSGPGGRIVKRDVEQALQSGAGRETLITPSIIVPGRDEHIPLSRLRSAIGKRMQESNQSIPHFFITRSFRVDDLMRVRQQMNDERDAEEKLSLNDFIVKACGLALRQFPNLNASLRDDAIVQHGDINIGNAVSLENGLLTVVVRNADQKTLNEISKETGDMAQRARDGKLRNEDVEGSTFTISNLGMYAVEDFVAIINPPEAAILAVGSAQEGAIVEQGQVKAGWLMKVTLSADHRITDGAEGALFLQHLAQFIEQPWRLM